MYRLSRSGNQSFGGLCEKEAKLSQSPRILLSELTRVESRVIAEDGLLVLPIGATEQHGPHLPVGTDAMGAEHVARAAAHVLGDQFPIAVAPTQWYGSSPHHIPFGGTMSLSADTLLRVLMDLGRSLARSHFRRLFIVNGHGGNHELIAVAARDLALEEDIEVGACSWWALASDELVAAGALDIGRLPGHAGAFESSIVLALDPSLVREPRPHRDDYSDAQLGTIDAAVRIERPGSWQAIDGYTDSPDKGSAELGEVFMKIGINKLVATLSSFYEASLAEGRAGTDS